MKKLIKVGISLCVIATIILSQTMVIAIDIIEENKINKPAETHNANQVETENKTNQVITKNNTNQTVTQKHTEDSAIQKNTTNQVENSTEMQKEEQKLQLVQEESQELTEPVEEQEETEKPSNIKATTKLASDGKETIEEGIYVIRSSINPKFVLDVNGASKDDGANVQLYEYSNDDQKKFKVTYLGDGYYSIIAVHSKKALDVKYGGTAIGTNVWQYVWTDTEPQKWKIQDTGDGNYSIIAKCNGLYLDVDNAIAANYTNIKMCNGNGLNAQKFQFEKVIEPQPVVGTKTLEDGTYVIRSSINPKFVLDVNGASKDNGANVQLYEYTNSNQKKFEVTYLGDGYYSIIAKHSNKALDVKYGEKAIGTNVWQYEWTNTDPQKWIIKEAGDGNYNIIAKCNGLYLDVHNAIAANYTNIQMCNGNGLNAQKFQFEKVVEPQPIVGTKTIEDGTYVIRSSINQRFALDVNGASQDNGANVQLYEYTNSNQKKFKVSYLGDGYYSIIAVHSNKALDVRYGGTEVGTNVWQYEWTDTDPQKWVIQKTEDGYYNIIAKCNGLYLDVHNGIAANYTNIQMCNGNGLNAQKFKFEKAVENDGKQTIAEGNYVLRSAINTRFAIEVAGASQDNGANVQLYEYAAGNQKKFKVEYAGDGCYTLTPLHSNKVLDVKDASTQKGANVWQWEYNGTDAQKWYIRDAGNGYYSIISKCNGLYIDVDNANASNGTNIQMCDGNGGNAQKFKFCPVGQSPYSEGTYGVTGLGRELKYYQYGKGPNVLFATFAMHGFEDLWAKDGEELITIANNFYWDLIARDDSEISDKWTIYIFPGVNMDGVTSGWSNNGPGRTTLYSSAPGNRGIDLNRCWQIGNSYQRYTDSRYYNGTAGFQACEAAYLRDFLLSHKAGNGQTLLVDLHGWLQEFIGDPDICRSFQSQFPENKATSIGRYGTGYLINWARTYLGSNGRVAKSALIELPGYVNGHDAVVNNGFINRYIVSAIDMLYNL